ncbi:MAG: transglycosylase domain-containing protein, partial [Candidatus Vogelbacteria bacterium]|nr:transglycosylase domain-containing protein [Candidatus Vogelbacteria bacterium]
GVKQGGSTITQQVVKNSLLTSDQTIVRKVKEAVLAVKMEKTMTKDEILNVYLNQTPYGGNIYGVPAAAQAYFQKDIRGIDIAESAYLAAMPKAPNYYSPYGPNKAQLDIRKNLVLTQMYKNGFITKGQMLKSQAEKVTFYEKINQGIKAPHFAYYILDQLEQKYDKQTLMTNSFKITTTIDWPLQEKAEELAKKFGDSNEKNYQAHNNGIVAIDPKNGDILAMVGSRDYFNQAIQGNFNVTTAHRQPGSSFKPFVYATAFNKGYTDKTIVFDLKTEFNTNCSPTGKPVTPGATCYMPVNYDGLYVGPITFRGALAQSRNIPAIKVLYLAGINASLDTARAMGITSLGTKNQYGLTLVLGGGEVSLLEMTSAYGVFANDGVRVPYEGILKIDDPDGKVVFEKKTSPTKVLPENTARLISDILSDEQARVPSYAIGSPLSFAGRDVAVKTGTTNDYKDAWIIGYTPNIVIGAWAGNNDNTPMGKKVAGFIVAPFWHAVMQEAITSRPVENFIPPVINYTGLKPALRGFWQGGEVVTTNVFSSTTGQMITNGGEYITRNVHSILYWLDKDNPLGPAPSNPTSDGQFALWEYPIQLWAKKNASQSNNLLKINRPGDTPTIATTSVNLPDSFGSSTTISF